MRSRQRAPDLLIAEAAGAAVGDYPQPIGRAVHTMHAGPNTLHNRTHLHAGRRRRNP